MKQRHAGKPRIEPVILTEVKAAEPPNPEKEDLISNLTLRYYQNVVSIGHNAAAIRHEIAAGALHDMRGQGRK